MQKVLGDKRAIFFFIFPGFLIFTVVVPIPIANSIYYGFFDWNILNEKTFVGLSNYISLFRDEYFTKSIINTIILTILSIVFQVSMSLALAVFLTKISAKARKFYQTAYYIPNVLSSSIIGILWMYVYNYDFGLLNSFLRFIGLESLASNWVGDKSTVLIALVIVTSWQWVGYHMIIFMTGIFNIPEEVIEAAKLDGAKGFKMLTSITVPLIWPVMKVSVIMIAIGSLKFFDMAWIMTEGGPDHASETIATFIYREAFNKMHYGYASAASTALFIGCIVVSVLMNKYFNKQNLQS